MTWQQVKKIIGCFSVFVSFFFKFKKMGELARKPGCPEIPKTPIEYLTPRPGEGYSTGEKIVWPLTGATVMVAIVAVVNVMSKRPYWASIPLHILGGSLGYIAGNVCRDIHFASRAEVDAVLRHYITLHPEDFPPFERVRYRDVYEPFQPYR